MSWWCINLHNGMVTKMMETSLFLTMSRLILDLWRKIDFSCTFLPTMNIWLISHMRLLKKLRKPLIRLKKLRKSLSNRIHQRVLHLPRNRRRLRASLHKCCSKVSTMIQRSQLCNRILYGMVDIKRKWKFCMSSRCMKRAIRFTYHLRKKLLMSWWQW